MLLHEGQSSLALSQFDEALALEPPASVHAEMLWLTARALRVNSESEMLALNPYLKYAPHGEKAPDALYRLGHLQWRTGDTKTARATFTRLAQEFPASELAPAAMFDIGRAYEDDAQWDLARAQYLRLVHSYPHSEEAADGRFRAPFALYMTGRFDVAASEFASMKPMAASASERDGLSYWHARSMERAGQSVAATAIYQSLAQSTASNYYPELAARRIGAPTAQLAGADATRLDVAVPSVAPGSLAAFHLDRATTLKRLGLSDLEAPELRALAATDSGDPRVRDFVLAEVAATGSGTRRFVATRLEKNGSLESSVAERLRYPRGYWDRIRRSPGRARSVPGARADPSGEPVQSEGAFGARRARTDAIDADDGRPVGPSAGVEHARSISMIRR